MPDELNIKSSTIEKGLDLVKGFLEKVIGPTVDELGLMWADNMKFRRAQNQLRIFAKAKRLAEEGNIQIKQIDLKALFPLLEGIALEENEPLQDMWANLLVNYIDLSKNLTTHVFPLILSQLSSDEVKILNRMKENFFALRIVSRIPKPEHMPDSSTAYDIANLLRLGLIEGIPKYETKDQGVLKGAGEYRIKGSRSEPILKILPPDRFTITYFGKQFLDACAIKDENPLNNIL